MRKNKLKHLMERSVAALMACVVAMPLIGQLSTAAEENKIYEQN